MAIQFGVHPTMTHQWTHALLAGASGVFGRCGRKSPEVDEEQVNDLHAKIGELAVASDFWPKTQTLDWELRLKMIEPNLLDISVGKRCPLQSILRLSFCYPQGRDGAEPRPDAIDGPEPIYRKLSTSKATKGHKIYPYLLRGLRVDQSDQVWCADIPYLSMRHEFLYLVAIMGLHTHKVLAWRIPNTLEADFCINALNEAIDKFGSA